MLRSLTKTWSLAGFGSAICLVIPASLPGSRRIGPIGLWALLQLEAIAACCEPDAVAAAEAESRAVGGHKVRDGSRIEELGLDVVGEVRRSSCSACRMGISSESI